MIGSPGPCAAGKYFAVDAGTSWKANANRAPGCCTPITANPSGPAQPWTSPNPREAHSPTRSPQALTTPRTPASLFKTAKHDPDGPLQFQKLQYAGNYFQELFAGYTSHRRHSGLNCHTPDTVHHGPVEQARSQRQQTLEVAPARKPAPPGIPPAAGINPQKTPGCHQQLDTSRSHRGKAAVMLTRLETTQPTASAPAAAPARAESTGQGRAGRVVGVDVARGVALMGIVIINVLPTEGRYQFVDAFFGGRAAALFALIAGISIALQSGGRRPPSGRAMTAARAALALRALMIVGIGLLLGPTNSPMGIILPYYGILFLLAVVLLGLGRRMLLALAVVFAVLGPVAMLLVRAGWPDMIQPEGNYTVAVAAGDPGVFVTDMLFTGIYPAVPWLAYICAGMAVGRSDLSSRKVAVSLLAAGIGLAASMWLLSVLLLGPAGGHQRIVAATPEMSVAEIDKMLVYGGNAVPATTGWWLAVLAPETSTPLTLLSTLGTSLAVLGAILLLVPYLGRAVEPLAAAGSMTLTLYSAHVIIMATEILNPDRPIVSITIQCILFLLAGVLWRSAVGKGPLEAILAAATGWLRTLVLTGHRPRSRQDPASAGQNTP